MKWFVGMAVAFGVALAASCGAVTLEAQPPEEPPPEAGAAPPRLVRREAGSAGEGRPLTDPSAPPPGAKDDAGP